MAKYAIYSCEGFSREILPSARNQVKSIEDDHDQFVFVDDDPEKVGKTVHGCAVISFGMLQDDQHRNRLVSVGIADPWIRKKIADKLQNAGFGFLSISDKSHIRFDNVVVDEGSIFCANTMVTGDTRIGRHFHCNIYSYVAHDSLIGDFVTFAPRVCCNGRVRIGDFAYIGTGAMLKQGVHDRPLTIGRGAVVGMGAVVLEDVPDGAVVVGNPAKVIRKIDVGN